MTACPMCGQEMQVKEELSLNFETNTVRRNGIIVALTPACAEVLHALIRRYPGVVTYDFLSEVLWGQSPPEYPTTCMRVQVSYLRRALKQIGVNVMSVYGVGYRLVYQQEMQQERKAA